MRNGIDTEALTSVGRIPCPFWIDQQGKLWEVNADKGGGVSQALFSFSRRREAMAYILGRMSERIGTVTGFEIFTRYPGGRLSRQAF
jgi:hypothetical protein